jgi:hypothetical protein
LELNAPAGIIISKELSRAVILPPEEPMVAVTGGPFGVPIGVVFVPVF